MPIPEEQDQAAYKAIRDIATDFPDRVSFDKFMADRYGDKYNDKFKGMADRVFQDIFYEILNSIPDESNIKIPWYNIQTKIANMKKYLLYLCLTIVLIALIIIAMNPTQSDFDNFVKAKYGVSHRESLSVSGGRIAYYGFYSIYQVKQGNWNVWTDRYNYYVQDTYIGFFKNFYFNGKQHR